MFHTRNWPETRADVTDCLEMAEEYLQQARRAVGDTYDTEWLKKLALIAEAQQQIDSAKLDLTRMLAEYHSAMAGQAQPFRLGGAVA